MNNYSQSTNNYSFLSCVHNNGEIGAVHDAQLTRRTLIDTRWTGRTYAAVGHFSLVVDVAGTYMHAQAATVCALAEVVVDNYLYGLFALHAMSP